MTDRVRHIDVSRLPAELAELIAGLAPGEALTVTRDGEPMAKITGAGGPLAGTVIRAQRSGDDGSRGDGGGSNGEVPRAGDGVTVVATAMKLSETIRTSLSSELGADYIVLDMETAPETSDILLVPPISLQLLEALRARFPQARVMVVEVEDPELGLDYRGPVRRMLDAGAEAYLASTTLPRLARQLERAVTHRPQLAADSARLAIEPRAEQ
jgi:antitoxin (DNA-binding transcriptional repressor) of toxin-antitoxin stability system